AISTGVIVLSIFIYFIISFFFFFSSRRRHTRSDRDWSSDVCSSDLFEFEHAEIAGIVEKSEANCRQILARAKQHIGAQRARFEATPEQAERLLDRFTRAATAGDIEGLLAVLAEDITLWSDGGEIGRA